MYYIYDSEDIRFETDEVGTITAEYTHGLGIDEPLAMRRGGVNYYYHVNGLGTVTALTDSNKSIVQEYVYDSFGQIVSQSGSIQNPYTYTGREYDEETGLYYYRARYYDASIGRFISEDPIGINGGINLYVYVGNNPVNYSDPLGLFLYGCTMQPTKDFRTLFKCARTVAAKDADDAFIKCSKCRFPGDPSSIAANTVRICVCYWCKLHPKKDIITCRQYLNACGDVTIQ